MSGGIPHTVALIKFAIRSFYTKVHQEKNRNKKKRDGSDKKSNSLSLIVEFFLIAVFFLGELLYTNSEYLPPPVSMYTVSKMRLPAPVILIFHVPVTWFPVLSKNR
jgi:hypothetical protein